MLTFRCAMTSEGFRLTTGNEEELASGPSASADVASVLSSQCSPDPEIGGMTPLFRYLCHETLLHANCGGAPSGLSRLAIAFALPVSGSPHVAAVRSVNS